MKNSLSIFALVGIVIGATAGTCVAGPCEDLLEMREQVYALKKEQRVSKNPERRSEIQGEINNLAMQIEDLEARPYMGTTVREACRD